MVGRCFAELRPLTAYRWDLVGSLLGILGFTLLSFLRAPSVVWGVLVTVGFLILIGGWQRIIAGVCRSAADRAAAPGVARAGGLVVAVLQDRVGRPRAWVGSR